MPGTETLYVARSAACSPVQSSRLASPATACPARNRDLRIDCPCLSRPRHSPAGIERDASGFQPFADEEGLILRILAVLNAEVERVDLGYETRARLYFYLGFQRYVMLRWLGVLPPHGSDLARQRSRRISAILQLLTSPLILEHEAIDEGLYRNMIARLSGEIFALLQVTRSRTTHALLRAETAARTRSE